MSAVKPLKPLFAAAGSTPADVTYFVLTQRAQLWIEHDIATHAALPKAPAYVE